MGFGVRARDGATCVHCVYCHDAAPDSAPRCPGCGVRYHADCLDEHRARRSGCVTLGCLTPLSLPGSPSAARAGRSPRRPLLPTWLLLGLVLSGSWLAWSSFMLLQVFCLGELRDDLPVGTLLFGSGIPFASMVALALVHSLPRGHSQYGRAAGPLRAAGRE